MNNNPKKKGTSQQIKLLPVLLLVLYGIITVITPNWGALDSNGTKFMTFSFVNLLTLAYLMYNKYLVGKDSLLKPLFCNAIAVVYALLMLVFLLSFVKAVNVLESVLHFAKVFSVFTAAIFSALLFKIEKRSLLYLSVAMSVLLIVDSITVFVGISNYIEGTLDSIGNLKSVYSNKNILAASLFVKIPFALWLVIFQRKILQKLGLLTVFLAQIGVFFMSARAFYVGLFFYAVAIVVFLLFRYRADRNKVHLRQLAWLMGSLMLAILIFSAVQRNFYPETKGGYNSTIAGRLSTINPDNKSTTVRLQIWKRTLHLIKEEPILGVGLGNWKVRVLKEENLTSPGYVLNYKAHNDFLETTAETGLIGGLLYLAIFGLVFWQFIRRFLDKNTNDEALSNFFLPAVGLVFYSFDALFNFPQDRPEIAALFALYAGAGMAFGDIRVPDNVVPAVSKKLNLPTILLPVLWALILLGSSTVHVLNYRSLWIQRFVHNELNQGKLIPRTAELVEKLPVIPNLNAVSEPIAVVKARYLMDKKKFRETITMLEKDQSSPWDGRKEFFLSVAYLNMGNIDSALFFARTFYDMKPNFYINVQHLCKLYLQVDQTAEGKEVLNTFLERNKRNGSAWLYAYSYFLTIGEVKKAKSLLDSANVYMPENKQLEKQQSLIGFNDQDIFFDESFEQALEAYNAKDFETAVKLFNVMLETNPDCNECLIKRAFAYYSLGENALSIADLEKLIEAGINKANILNLLGVNHYLLGNEAKACEYFLQAKDQGDPEGLMNYNHLCVEKDFISSP